MRPLAYTKLKVYKKSIRLKNRIKKFQKIQNTSEGTEFLSMLLENLEQTLVLIKNTSYETKIASRFIESMEEVILNNSEFELLLSVYRPNQHLSDEEYTILLEECTALRDLELDIFNKAPRYFKTKKIPEGWYGDLEE